MRPVENDDEHWGTGVRNPGFASRTSRDSIVNCGRRGLDVDLHIDSVSMAVLWLVVSCVTSGRGQKGNVIDV
jgi:hypothetical protein